MKTGAKPSPSSSPSAVSAATFDSAYGVIGRSSEVSSSASSPPDAPYIEHDEAKTKRPTPAAFAARARATVPSRLISYVQDEFRSPSGSFERAPRWTIASKPSRSALDTSRRSSASDGWSSDAGPKSHPR